MRQDSVLFTQANAKLTKRPRYVVEVAFDDDATVLRYFTSHADSALPDGAVAVLRVVQGLSGTSQTLNPDLAQATIGNFNFQLVDRQGAVTLALGGQLALGRSTRLHRVRLYVGYEGLNWADYALVLTQQVQDVSYVNGLYSVRCLDVQRQLRKAVFDVAHTNLAASALAGDETINVVSTFGFELVNHGPSYSDAPNAPVGYLRIEDELIRYTGTTSTSFTGCKRGVLNTLAVDHLIDLTQAGERQTEVKEYVYLELPAVKLMHALMTGELYGQRSVSLPGSSSNYASTPDSAANSVTGDLDLRAKIAPTNWTPGVNHSILCKSHLSNQTSFGFQLLSNGKLELFWSTDGTTLITKDSVPLPDTENSVVRWVRVTLDVNNGGGGNNVIFYTSDNYDPVLGTGSWTQLGGSVVTVGVTSIFNSDAEVEVGSRADGTTSTLFTGKIYYAEMRNGIDGPIAAAFDANTFAVGGLVANAATGEVWTVHQSGGTPAAIVAETLPEAWHLGVLPVWVATSEFTTIGDDLWRPTDDEQGFVAFLQGLEKTDGKKFLETELARLVGVFMPVKADGTLGCRRSSNVLTGASYEVVLDESNVVWYGELLHDFGSMHNVLEVDWDWEPLTDDFTRKNFLIDAGSVSIYGEADTLKLGFRALHGSRHSAVMLQHMFDALRDRYSAPPWRLELRTLATLNALEVGTVVRVKLANVRDYVATTGSEVGSLDRSFEVQNVSVDWITGALQLKLMATSRAPDAIPATGDATVLSDEWYNGTGVALSTVLSISGSNPGHVVASGNLAGHPNLLNPAAIYYYEGDLQIDAGVVITVNNNVWLRVKGFLQLNGKLIGKGRGQPGASVYSGPIVTFDEQTLGTPSFLGYTEAGGGLYSSTSRRSVVVGASKIFGVAFATHPTMPQFNLSWDGVEIGGMPSDLRGTSGSSGKPSSFNVSLHTEPGGAGGNSGAGLCLTCRGFARGAAGSVDLSGDDGLVGTRVDAFIGGQLSASMYPGSGAGGAPGGLLILLDGASVTATGLDDSGAIMLQGKTPIPGIPVSLDGKSNGTPMYSFFVGTGDGTVSNGGASQLPLPNLSGGRGGVRVQNVPGNPALSLPTDIDKISELNLVRISNWTTIVDTKAQALNGVMADKTAPVPYVAVGQADATDGYILTSGDGSTFQEQANPLALGLTDVVWGAGAGVYAAVGLVQAATRGAYLLSSANASTWTQRTFPNPPGALGSASARAVCWSPTVGRFVAAGGGFKTGGSPNRLAWTRYSSDGLTWTDGLNNDDSDVNDVCWSPDLRLYVLVISGGFAGGNAKLYTSPDGINWTLRTIPNNSATLKLNAVASGRGVAVAAGSETGSVNYLIWSRDGVTWTRADLTTLPFVDVNAVTFTAGLFLAVAGGLAYAGGVSTRIIYSVNGVNWASREAGLRPSSGVAWSQGDFGLVVGPNNGSGNGYLATTLK